MTRDQLAAQFRRFAPLVHRRALVLLGNSSDAEDATQEVFIRALKNGDKFEERSQVSTWLYRITTNYCLDTLRARRTYMKLLRAELETADMGVPGAPAMAEMMVLRDLLCEADDREAQAAIYVYVDGMSHEEAASVLGVSRRTIGNLLERFGCWARARIDRKEKGLHD